MRASPWCALAALCLACGGDPAASDGGGTSPADAAPAVDSAIATCECDSGEVCAGGACVASECGDAIVDPAAGEECDDGNDTAFDGCEPDCTFTCRESSVCSDRDPCNGEEVCGAESHRCEAGTPLADASACSTSAQPNGVCRAATCVAAGCGNGVVDGSEECDDGNTVARDGCEMDCRLSCTTDAACDDRDACNGNETCDMETHACVPGTALSCDDASPCTNDSCDASLGCVFALIDADLDGQAPDSLGSCGTDCNDMRDDVYLGAVELCDSIDHDCDGASLPAEAPLWYLDCDGDGYASSGAFSVRQCDPPAPAACGGGYTARVPVGGDVDCDDARADVRPRLTEMTGDPTDTDENCDGMIACFEDADGDGYRTGRVVLSSDADCADAG
ncbi:MAG: DUF4215 domain-containing protein, partial [Sandaracinaceae bacterium]|nr:DUF4215 domain-containing protein [Sandaracinaceae bacterium]